MNLRSQSTTFQKIIGLIRFSTGYWLRSIFVRSPSL